MACTQANKVSILEIKLFSVSAQYIYEAAANECDNVHLTVIDPLDGYYASGNRDILTGAQVSETTLRHNWSRAPIPEENYTIIKHLSTDSAALEEARRREYDVLIIDGNHSFDGVKFDFEHYGPMVRQGGTFCSTTTMSRNGLISSAMWTPKSSSSGRYTA